MFPFQMRPFWYASLLLLLPVLACTSRFHSSPAPSSASRFESLSLYVLWPEQDSSYATLQFATHVNVYGKEIEGILLLKKRSSQLYRATFLAKGSYKLFDIELMPDTFRVVENAEQLSNPAALRTLAHDMQLLTHSLHQKMAVQDVVAETRTWQMNQNTKTRIYFRFTNNQLEELLETDPNDKMNIQLLLTDYQNGKPRKLSLQHLRFRMRMELTRMEN